MTYSIISTGSEGNAVVLDGGILIDCGVTFKALKKVWRGLQLVLLTHRHGDHFNKKTIRRLAKERPLLRFGACEWLIADLIACGVAPERIDYMKPDRFFDYGAFQVCPVRLTHNVPNCGWRILLNGERIFYATDTGTLEGISAKDYDLYMIEANYEEEEIQERIARKVAAGMYPYEYEVLKNHLSVRQALDFIFSNAGPQSEYVFLHQHKERKEDEA